jgi:hypothetical protein
MGRDPARPYYLIMRISAVGWGRRPVGLLTDPALDADEVRRIRRLPRDWVVDALCFLLAVGYTVLAFVDGRDRHLGPVPLAVDVFLGGLCCLGVWLHQLWPVGFAVTAILFSVFSTAASVWH